MSEVQIPSRPYFIAFPVHATSIAPLQSTLPDAVKAVGRADLHVTLAFLGAVHEANAQAAFEVARRADLAPIRANVTGLTLLGPAARPWAVCATVDTAHSDVINAIIELRNSCRTAAGVGPEERAVIPHVTLGAIDRRASDQQRAKVAAWVGTTVDAGWTVRLDTIALYTHADGRDRYRVVRAERLVRQEAAAPGD